MPTAEDFDAAATALESVAGRVGPVVGPVAGAMSERVLSGGVVTATVERVVEDGTSTTSRQGSELSELAAECRRRAQVCREAAAALSAYHDQVAAHDREMSRWRADGLRHRADPDAFADPGRPPGHPGRPPSRPSWVEL